MYEYKHTHSHIPGIYVLIHRVETHTKMTLLFITVFKPMEASEFRNELLNTKEDIWKNGSQTVVGSL